MGLSAVVERKSEETSRALGDFGTNLGGSNERIDIFSSPSAMVNIAGSTNHEIFRQLYVTQ